MDAVGAGQRHTSGRSLTISSVAAPAVSSRSNRAAPQAAGRRAPCREAGARGARRDQSAGQPLQRRRRRAAIQEHAEPGRRQPRQSGGGEVHRPLKRVRAIAELLDVGGHARVQQFAELLQRAERFLQPQKIGR